MSKSSTFEWLTEDRSASGRMTNYWSHSSRCYDFVRERNLMATVDKSQSFDSLVRSKMWLTLPKPRKRKYDGLGLGYGLGLGLGLR